MQQYPTDHDIWQALSEHQVSLEKEHMRDWFLADQARFQRYSLTVGALCLDYSRNRMTDDTLSLLQTLAEAMSLREKIDALFAGKALNVVENRSALHTALRDERGQPIYVNDEDVSVLIAETLDKMRHFTDQVHRGLWRGATGKPIQSIVTLGMGGSFLGARMASAALKDFSKKHCRLYFIASSDPALMHDVLSEIDPEATLFIIVSKTFTTLETVTNARFLLTWMQARLGEEACTQHFVAVTAETERACAFGIPADHIFPIWDFVGGRYSVWSAVGLPLMLQIGSDAFDEFLSGAFLMDEHFKSAPFLQNMPVLLALLSVWYVNFFHVRAHAIVPYSYRLRYLVPYLQQLSMESNGKSVDIYGRAIHYATAPVIFGDEGSAGQHAFHQLLHQGNQLIPVDFILVGETADMLLASGLSQAQALMQGKTYEEARNALLHASLSKETADYLAAHQVNAGNRPSNLLLMKQLTPKTLGTLLALYEHKTFTESVLWNVNAFDQWGVELGKQLLSPILHAVQTLDHASLDPATRGFLQYLSQEECDYVE